MAALLLRRAHERADDAGERAHIALVLEQLLEEIVVDDDLRSVEVVDGAGRPLDGAISLTFEAPSWDLGWDHTLRWTTQRSVHDGAARPGLVNGGRLASHVRYSRSVERARAGLVDGEGQVVTAGARVVRVVVRTLPDALSRPITGRVVRVRDLLPRPWVRVALFGESVSPLDGLQARTDEDGRYRFDAVPPGRYRVGVVDVRGLRENEPTVPGDDVLLGAPDDLPLVHDDDGVGKAVSELQDLVSAAGERHGLRVRGSCERWWRVRPR